MFGLHGLELFSFTSDFYTLHYNEKDNLFNRPISGLWAVGTG